MPERAQRARRAGHVRGLRRAAGTAVIVLISCPSSWRSSCASSIGGVPGERQEHLVEAGQAQCQLGDRDAFGLQARDDGRQRLRVVDGDRQQARVFRGRRRCGCRPRPSTIAATAAQVGRVGRAYVQRLAADLRLQLGRRAARDDACRGRSPRSRWRAGRPRPGTASSAARSCPRRRARAPSPRRRPGCAGRGRSSARRGTGSSAWLTQARGQVEPPPHAAGVGLGRSAAGLGQVESLEQLAGALLAPRGGRSRAAGRSAAGSRSRSGPRRPPRTGRSARSAPAPRRPRARRRSRRRSRVPPSGRSSVASIRTTVVLPAPLGPSRPKHGAGPHSEVDAGHGRRLPEPFDQAFGLDCVGHDQYAFRLCHARACTVPLTDRVHGADTAVIWVPRRPRSA